MTTLEDREAVVDAVDTLEPEAVAFLKEMVRTPSVNPPGVYAAVRDVVASAFEEYGWDVETAYAPEDLVSELDLADPRPNVLGYASRGDGPTIALNAHMDTVPVDESEWETDPFGATVRDGRLYGRGAYDSKARVASYALAARALDRAGLLPDDATVVVAVTADEETGGAAGAEYVLESGLLDPDYAIVEGKSTVVHHAACGVLHLEVTVAGRAAHAKNPDEGSSAVRGMQAVLAGIDEYAAELGEATSDVRGVDGPTCTVATIEGGTKTNVVPSSCSVTVDMRVPPDFDHTELKSGFTDAVDAATLPEGTSASVETLLAARPYRFDPDDTHVQTVRCNAAELLGQDLPVRGTRGFTDARFFAAAGAKTVKYGPGDDQSNAHSADESVALDQVGDTAAVVAASVLDMAE